MKFHLQISENPEDFEETDWDRIAGTSLFASHRWQRYWAAAQVRSWPRSRTALIAVRDRGVIVGHCGAYRYPYSLPAPARWQRRILRSCLWPANPVNFHKPPTIDPNADASTVLSCLDEGIRVLRRRWSAPAARFVMLDPVGDMHLINCLKMHGYICTPGIADTVLKVQWGDFDTYIKEALLSKDRNYLKRCYDKAENNNVKFINIKTGSIQGRHLFPLIFNVANNNLSEPILNQEFMSAADSCLHDNDICIILACVEDCVSGCLICYCNDNQIIMKSIGLDYDLSHTYNLYRLLIAEGIRYAIKEKFNIIRCGYSNYSIKKKLGFDVIETVTAVKSWPKILNRYFSYRSSSMIAPHNKKVDA